MSRLLLAIAVWVGLAGVVAGQEPPRFRWQPGQALRFDVSHASTITESLADTPPTVTTVKLTLARTWTVASVDPTGTATLDMTITAMRQEITRRGPDGQPETLTRDSAVPADAADMADYLNKPVLRVTLDNRGRLAEPPVGPGADRLTAELPFRVVLPEKAAETLWERTFAFEVGPPAGTGEKYELRQTYTRKEPGVIGLGTEVVNPPPAAADRQPLLPLLWAGEVFLDEAAGAYRGARLTLKRELRNHAGPGSRFEIEGTFTETPAK